MARLLSGTSVPCCAGDEVGLGNLSLSCLGLAGSGFSVGSVIGFSSK